MSSINKNAKIKERNLTSFEKLQRTVMCCLLWESNATENGVSIIDRVDEYFNDITKEQAIQLIKECKFDNKLRHMSLYLLTKMLKKGWCDVDLVSSIITRVDDMSEFLALYWNDKNNKHMIPHVIQKAFAKCFTKFDEYQFGKYKGTKKEIKLKDVLKLSRPKPINDEQSKLFKKILDDTLSIPDTWEVELSKSKDKKESWTRLLNENKLGALALIRNLRNMENSNVNEDIIRNSLKNCNTSKILPFQLVTSERYAPNYSDILQDKLLESMKSMDKLNGDTIILIDVSGSMYTKLSSKSDCEYVEVAAAVGAIAKEVCDNATVYGFDTKLKDTHKSYHGFSLINEIREFHGGCTSVINCTNEAINKYKRSHDNNYPNRIIVVTDEQTNSDTLNSRLDKLNNESKGYIINVSSHENGVEYTNNSRWNHINGWSENVIKYISKVESVR